MPYSRRLLFYVLGVNSYLTVVRKTFFVLFKSGVLKRNPVYHWHYFARKLIRKGDVVIDIGANMGYYASNFSSIIGNSGRLYCVEPVGPLVRQLTRQLRSRKNVSIFPCALGSEEKQRISLSIPGGVATCGYLRHGLFCVSEPGSASTGKQVYTAPLRKGSDLFGRLDRVDYIKCDVEGYENFILQDLETLIARCQPMVQVEIGDGNLQMVMNLFTRLRYRAFKLDKGRLVAPGTLPAEKRYYFDTLFVPLRHFDRIKTIARVEKIIAASPAGPLSYCP